MTVTAKAMCTAKTEETDNDGAVVSADVTQGADYADGRNATWAAATPNLYIRMTLNGTACNAFQLGERYTITFEETVEEPDMSTGQQPAENPFVDEAPVDETQDQEEAIQHNEEFKKTWEDES